MQALLAGSSFASGAASTGLHPQPCTPQPASVMTCRRPAPLAGLVSMRQPVNLRTPCCAAKQPRDNNRSFDSDEDLDADLAGELKSRVEPERLKNLANRLNLAWTIARSRTPQMCETCSGTKETECTWCHGTGFLMVGDSLVTIGRNGAGACPVCKGKGYSPCEHCRGTGYRAKWLGTNPPLES